MEYALNFSHEIRNGTNRYYWKTRIYFTEEEKAIIRVRNLGGYELLFRKGYVNYPELATDSTNDTASLAIYIVAGLFALGLFEQGRAIMAIVICLPCAFLMDHNNNVRKAHESADRTTIDLDEIMNDGSFSVCGFHNLFNSKAVEKEIHEQMCQIACNRDPGIASKTDPLAA